MQGVPNPRLSGSQVSHQEGPPNSGGLELFEGRVWRELKGEPAEGHDAFVAKLLCG